MKIKTKKVQVHKIKVTEKELDTLQLAIGLMLEDPESHPRWRKILCPMLKEMRAALKDGEFYEPIENCN